MVKVDFLPRQYQIILSPEDYLEVILGLRQYVKEFTEGTYRIQEILEIMEAKYIGDLPQQEEEEKDGTGSEGDVGGATVG